MPGPLNAEPEPEPEERDHGLPGMERNGGQWIGARLRGEVPQQVALLQEVQQHLEEVAPPAAVIVEGKDIVMPATSMSVHGTPLGDGLWDDRPE